MRNRWPTLGATHEARRRARVRAARLEAGRAGSAAAAADRRRKDDVHRHRAGSRRARGAAKRARVRPAPKIAASRWPMRADRARTAQPRRQHLRGRRLPHGRGARCGELLRRRVGRNAAVTTLGAKRDGARVNLEPALRAGDSLGGHWVSGHVDGLAEVLATVERRALAARGIRSAEPLARYIARKGSVTLDGVSLTVNEVDGAKFSVNLIPHTLEVTTLGALARRLARQSRNRSAGALRRAAAQWNPHEAAQQHRRDPRRHRRRPHGRDHGRRGSRERRRSHHGRAEGARRKTSTSWRASAAASSASR